MVCHSISAPVEVNYRAGSRNAVPILPLASGAEPFHAGGTVRMLGHNAGFNITALVGAPAHKTGAPLYAGAESIPAPIRLTAHIAHLAQRHSDNIVTAATRYGQTGPQLRIFLRKQLGDIAELLFVEAVFLRHLLGSLSGDGDYQPGSFHGLSFLHHAVLVCTILSGHQHSYFLRVDFRSKLDHRHVPEN